MTTLNLQSLLFTNLDLHTKNLPKRSVEHLMWLAHKGMCANFSQTEMETLASANPLNLHPW